MWIRRAAPEGAASRPIRCEEPSRGGTSARTVAWLVALLLVAGVPRISPAQSPASGSPRGDESLIATVSTNGVVRGEVTLIRKPDGDYWVAAADLPVLHLKPVPSASRRAAGEDYFSLMALGAVGMQFDEAQLLLQVQFRTDALESNRLDLSTRPPAMEVTPAGASLILSYRLATRGGEQSRTTTTLDSDINVRLGPLLLRQEMHLSSGEGRRFTRGATQAIVDDTTSGRRVIVGDVVSTAGAFGSAVTGAGVLVQRVFDLTPDVIRQPTASLQASAALPAQVEVSIDGTPFYRSTVGPGPIRLDNLLLNGGSRRVRLTVTDASGRREVIEQPFFFTDAVLAPGLHEYSYFAGRRSVLDRDGSWRYAEAAWQGFHRYGVNDHLTVGAGGEGSAAFTNAGAGIALRSDSLGVTSVELLASRDRRLGARASGHSVRHTYALPEGSVFLGRRVFDAGFRSFSTTDVSPFLRREDQLGLSMRLPVGVLSFEYSRSRDALEDRRFRALRYSRGIGPRIALLAELQSSRSNGREETAGYLILRFELDGNRWVGGTARASQGTRSLDVEAGQVLPQGEGVGWRVGMHTNAASGGSTSSGYATAEWNLAPATIGVFANAPISGRGSSAAELAVAGSVVAVDGYWGLTRPVNDSFVLARLGVPQPGVDVLLNNQVQARTDARGDALIPQVGALGRQEVSVAEKQLRLEYNLLERRRTIVPAPRSGTVVDFGGRRMRAVAGMAWVALGKQRQPIATRAFTLSAAGRTLRVETGRAGDFYLEDAQPGRYSGPLEFGGRRYACALEVPETTDAVHELKEGIVCE